MMCFYGETLKRHWNGDKKFEIILYLGPSLKLVQKNVKISHLIKPKDQNFDVVINFSSRHNSYINLLMVKTIGMKKLQKFCIGFGGCV